MLRTRTNYNFFVCLYDINLKLKKIIESRTISTDQSSAAVLTLLVLRRLTLLVDPNLIFQLNVDRTNNENLTIMDNGIMDN